MQRLKLETKKRIQEWLEASEGVQSFFCPLRPQGYLKCKICDEIFPRTKGNFRCPCVQYKRNTVKTRARKLLKGDYHAKKG